MSTTISNRKQIDYNKVVNFDSETRQITVLSYVFDYGDGFKGATGSIFEPISKQSHDEAIEDENIIDYLVDSGIELTQDQKRDGFSGVVATMDDAERSSFMFDLSYQELWPMLRKSCGLNEDEAYIFNCIGGGRCFDADFTGNKNKPLSKIIRQYETR